MRWLVFGRDDGHGFVQPWNPVIAERHAATTARMLLGSVLSVRRQSPDEVRRAQFLARRRGETGAGPGAAPAEGDAMTRDETGEADWTEARRLLKLEEEGRDA